MSSSLCNKLPIDFQGLTGTVREATVRECMNFSEIIIEFVKLSPELKGKDDKDEIASVLTDLFNSVPSAMSTLSEMCSLKFDGKEVSLLDLSMEYFMAVVKTLMEVNKSFLERILTTMQSLEAE